MTPRVFIERPIESMEDAEALPEGAVVIFEGHSAWIGTCDDGKVEFIDGEGDLIKPRQMIGWTALVPVEAEEETEEPHGLRIAHGGTYMWPGRHRLVTPWEDA